MTISRQPMFPSRVSPVNSSPLKPQTGVPNGVAVERALQIARTLNFLVNDASTSINRIVIFEDENSPRSSTARSVQAKIGQVEIATFPLSRISAVPLRPEDMVVVETASNDQEYLDGIRGSLEKLGAPAYRGMFARGISSELVEVAKPLGRLIQPRRFSSSSSFDLASDRA